MATADFGLKIASLLLVFILCLLPFTVGFALRIIKIQATGTHIFLGLFVALAISVFFPWTTDSSLSTLLSFTLGFITFLFSVVYISSAYDEKKQRETSETNNPSSSRFIAWRALGYIILLFAGVYFIIWLIFSSFISRIVISIFFLLGILIFHIYSTIKQSHTKKEPVFPNLLWSIGQYFAFILVGFLLDMYKDHYTLNSLFTFIALFLFALSCVLLICSLLLKKHNKRLRQAQDL